MNREKEILFNQAKQHLLNEGWVYAGVCNCSSLIHKFRKGKYIIKLFKTSGQARLLFKNETIKNAVAKDIQELTDYVNRETAVPA